MTREEHLLTILAEECCEVGQRVSKILRFGMDETQEGKSETNRVRLQGEMFDLLAMMDMLNNEGIVITLSHDDYNSFLNKKQERVEHYLKYSKEQGRLD